MKNTEKNNPESVDSEIKDKIQFAFVLQDRIFMINRAFDSNDKYKIREALHTCFDNLSPYLGKNTKHSLKKKIKEIRGISDKEEFFDKSHEFFQDLLKVMKYRDMLMREIPVSMG